MVRYSFLVGLFHSLQHAGLTRRSLVNALPVNVKYYFTFPISRLHVRVGRQSSNHLSAEGVIRQAQRMSLY